MIVGGIPMLFGGAAPAGDPYFANVELLLHADGVNGATTFVDNSITPKTVTAVGQAQLGTAQAKFGSASILFDGAGDAIDIASVSSFQFLQQLTESYTVEVFVRTTSLAGYQALIQITDGGNGGGNISYSMFIADTAAGGMPYVYFTNNNLTLGSYVAGQASVTVNAWQHVAHVYNQPNDTHYIFLGGALVTSKVTTAGWVRTRTATQGPRTGAEILNATSPFVGNMDEVRITKGVARYTSAFTPPVAAFPNS